MRQGTLRRLAHVPWGSPREDVQETSIRSMSLDRGNLCQKLIHGTHV